MTNERAYKLAKKLLKAEELADSLNLTSEERKEFQQIIKTALIIQKNQVEKICINTPEGTLIAYKGTDPNYPAIHTMLVPSGTDYEIDMATVEFHPDKGLRMLIWGDVMDEDYTYAESLVGLKEYREQLEEAERIEQQEVEEAKAD